MFKVWHSKRNPTLSLTGYLLKDPAVSCGALTMPDLTFVFRPQSVTPHLLPELISSVLCSGVDALAYYTFARKRSYRSPRFVNNGESRLCYNPPEFADFALLGGLK